VHHKGTVDKTHNNTNLTAANINLNTTQDTKIKGANLQATNQLNIETALFALSELAVLFALAWRFKSTMVVVLFGVLGFVLAMVGAVARVVQLTLPPLCIKKI
jgi:urea transporter